MEKFSDVRSFSNFRMNLDSAPELLAPNEGRETVNMIEPNRSGKLTNMKGFEKIMDLAVNSAFVLPSGAVFKCVGTCYDVENSAIYYALCDVTGVPIRMIDPPTPVANLSKHCIIRMLTDSKKLEYVLKAEAYLNFKYNHRVKMSVIEGLLYFTDGYFGSFLNNDFNPPRKINIVKAMAYTTAYNGTDKDTVTMVGNAKYWPAFHPTYVDSAGNPYTVYEVSDATKFADGTAVVAWLHEGTAYGYRFKPATGYGVVIDSFRYGAKYYVVTDRIWTDTVYFSMNKTGHILEYAPDMYFGIDWQVLDRVKWPPSFAPSVSYDSDTTTKVNLITGQLFQFAYRWIYDDNEKSVFSPISEVPIPTQRGALDGSPYPDPSVDNRINVWVDTGSMEVKTVEIAVRKGNIGNWVLVSRKYKYDENSDMILTNDVYNPFYFYNNEVGEGLDQLDVARPYDAVPLISARHEIIEKNRILDADYREGFDNINIDVNLSAMTVGVNVGSEEIVNTNFIKRHCIAAATQFDYFYTGVISMSGMWFPGSTYTVSISNLPNAYNDTRNLLYNPYPTEFLNKTIDGVITIHTLITTTFENFVNDLCGRLRQGFGNSCVIAISPNSLMDYDTFGNYTSLTRSVGGGHIVSGYEIGFIVEPTHALGPGGTGEACLTCSTIETSISKTDPLNIFQSFKSGATHPFCIIYKDRASRTSMANVSDDSKIYLPSETEEYPLETLKQNQIAWTVSHVPPLEATEYSWGYAKNTTKSFFLYAAIADFGVAGGYLYVNINKYISESKDLCSGFNVAAYQWEKGDRIRFAFVMNPDIIPGRKTWRAFNDNVDLEIMGDQYSGADIYKKDQLNANILDGNGNKVPDMQYSVLYIPNFDYAGMGIVKGDDSKYHVVVEIYRSKKESENPLYYQFGNWMPILNPHTSSRLHGCGTDEYSFNQTTTTPAKGRFTTGDVYLYLRSMIEIYPCESDSYSDFYNSNIISIGRDTAVFAYAAFTRYISKLLFSGKLIQNTRVNDLSRVDSSDCVELPDKYGAINSIEEVGYTLKILQKSKPSSLYIGRAGVTQPSADAKEILSSTKDVLGTLIVHDSDYGTVHPDSVVKVETRYYFFDYYAYAICRDSGNGVKNISEQYNINSFLQEKCRLFGSADNVDVISAYDQANELVLFTFTDKTTDANSFTIAFHDMGGTENDGFVTFMDWDGQPDYYGTAKQTLTSFKGNDLYLHNSDTADRSTFYGTLSKYWVTIVSNKLPLIIKRWMSIFVSSNKKFSCPNAGDVSIAETGNTPGGMTSLIKAGAFTSIEGKYVADFGKNMTTNQTTATYADLVNGDDMEGQAMEVRLEGEESTEHKLLGVELQGVTSKI